MKDSLYAAAVFVLLAMLAFPAHAKKPARVASPAVVDVAVGDPATDPLLGPAFRALGERLRKLGDARLIALHRRSAADARWSVSGRRYPDPKMVTLFVREGGQPAIRVVRAPYEKLEAARRERVLLFALLIATSAHPDAMDKDTRERARQAAALVVDRIEKPELKRSLLAKALVAWPAAPAPVTAKGP